MMQLSMCVVRNWNILSQGMKMMLRIFQWFFDNSIKLNPDKCHRGGNMDLSVCIGETMVTESVEEKLLGVTLEKNLNFK